MRRLEAFFAQVNAGDIPAFDTPREMAEEASQFVYEDWDRWVAGQKFEEARLRGALAAADMLGIEPNAGPGGAV